MWKFQDFSVIQILRETNLGSLEALPFLVMLGALNFVVLVNTYIFLKCKKIVESSVLQNGKFCPSTGCSAEIFTFTLCYVVKKKNWSKAGFTTKTFKNVCIQVKLAQYLSFRAIYVHLYVTYSKKTLNARGSILKPSRRFNFYTVWFYLYVSYGNQNEA